MPAAHAPDVDLWRGHLDRAALAVRNGDDVARAVVIDGDEQRVRAGGLEAGRGAFGLIGHTQPRRIAARALANRLAEELQTTVGGAVGYQVRFNDRTGPDTRIKLINGLALLRAKREELPRRKHGNVPL